MKTLNNGNKVKMPVVRTDKSLNKYDGKVLFPEKAAKAKKAFEKPGLPGNNHHQ